MFKKFLSYQKHILSHGRKSTCGSIDYMCDRGDCGKRFESNYALQHHIDMHDNNLEGCFFCSWRGIVRDFYYERFLKSMTPSCGWI